MPGGLKTKLNINSTESALFLTEKYVSQQVSQLFFKGKLLKACPMLLTPQWLAPTFWLGIGVGNLRALCAVGESSLVLGLALSCHFHSQGLTKSRLSSLWTLMGFCIESTVPSSSHAVASSAGSVNQKFAVCHFLCHMKKIWLCN